MKNKFLFCSLILSGLIFLTTQCEKDNKEATIADADGNVYSSVTIGDQVWMGENLKTTKFNDDMPITYVGDDEVVWINKTTEAYTWFETDIANRAVYGALYNGYAVSTDKLCPAGWHVPTRDEWLILINYLGGVDVAGGKLKEVGLAHWATPNEGATDEVGFRALPGGYRGHAGAFVGFLEYANWWTSSDNVSDEDWSTHMFVTSDEAGIAYNSFQKYYGLSVRCLKD